MLISKLSRLNLKKHLDLRSLKHPVLIALCCIAVIRCELSKAENIETDPTIQYLIGAPTSLMDKGVFEIERKIDAANVNFYFRSIQPKQLNGLWLRPLVVVQPLSIVLVIRIYPEGSIENGRDTCRILIRYAEDILGFQSGEGRPKYMSESLAELFGHYRYAPVGHPTNLGERLKGLFAVEGGIVPNIGDKHFCHTVGGGPINDGELKMNVNDVGLKR